MTDYALTPSLRRLRSALVSACSERAMVAASFMCGRAFPGGSGIAVLLADFATVWSELFLAEQARIVQLLVERVDLQEEAIEVRIRAEGRASLVGELQQPGERKAA